MTKKHYEAIAKIMNEQGSKCHAIKLMGLQEQTCEQLADYFVTDNPKFDRTRFLQACGIDQ